MPRSFLGMSRFWVDNVSTKHRAKRSSGFERPARETCAGFFDWPSPLHEDVPHAVGLVPELNQPAVVHYAVGDALGGALYVAAARDDLVQHLPPQDREARGGDCSGILSRPRFGGPGRPRPRGGIELAILPILPRTPPCGEIRGSSRLCGGGQCHGALCPGF